MRKLVIVVLILIAIPVVWYRWNFPTVSYRYRLTVAVEVDGQVHSGSSVIEVQYSFNPKWVPPSWGVYNASVSGQAVLIDLGARGTLVAALHSGTGSGHVGVNADVLAARAFDPAGRSLGSGYPAILEKLRAVSRMQGHRDLTADNLPPFIWFSDVTNPDTARLLKPADFAGVVGDSARLASAEVEITSDPLAIDLDKRLPWYAALKATNGALKVATNGALKVDEILLGYTAFIGNGTLQ
jgi:hypothetical protein